MLNFWELAELLNRYLFGVGVPVMLICLGLFYCIRLKFFHFLHPMRVIKRMCVPSGNMRSSMRAFAMALAGTLGVGNMVGVASAIVLGGFGAVFWMWVSALVAMILKYAEIVLAILYRKYGSDGKPRGSAMYYIRACFRGRLGGILAAVFAMLCIINSLTMGSMIQVGAAASAMESSFGIPAPYVGAALAAVVLAAMLGGHSAIPTLTEKIVPVMTGGFVLLSLAVIAICPQEALGAVKLIFADAFSLRSGVGGAFGFLLSGALRYGSMRGIVSNEAGCGTAPAAHATAECQSPATQGLWGIFEVFADTVILCTLTAIVIIVSFGQVAASGGNYMELTLNSYTAVLGNAAGYFIAPSVMLFGLAACLCWGYYGAESLGYLTEGLCAPARRAANCIFAVIYSGCAFAGSLPISDAAWQLADLAIGGMTLINLCALMLMSGMVREESKQLFDNS